MINIDIKDKEIRRQIIIDHFSYPRHRKKLDKNGQWFIHQNSDLCIDDLQIELKITNNMISNVGFDGIACAIATASIDIMLGLILNKSIEEIQIILKQFYNMIRNEKYDIELLQEANAFYETHRQPNRIKCVTLGADGIAKLIERYQNENK